MSNPLNAYSSAARLSRRRFLGLALPLAGALLSACSGSSQSASGGPPTRRLSEGTLIAWPAKNQWPEQFWQASPQAQEAYRFAVANPDVLQYFPCYCGCVNGGHTSNKNCYIDEFRPDGSVVLDPMSFG